MSRPSRKSFDDWKLLVAAATVQVLVGAALKVASLSTVRSTAAALCTVLANARVPAQPDARLHPSEERLVWAVNATGRRLGALSTCLVRAVVLEAFLQNPAVSLTIGVRRSADGRIESHAWLSHGVHVLIGGPVDGYVPMVSWTGRVS